MLSCARVLVLACLHAVLARLRLLDPSSPIDERSRLDELGIRFLFLGFAWDAALAVVDGEGGVDREIFFSDFFTILILADILILLLSYRFTVDFANLARNTGFILSTVILRVAISAPGVSAVILFTLSGILGLAILRISSEFVKDKRNTT